MVKRYFRAAYLSFLVHVVDIPPRFFAFLIFIIFLLFPITGPPESILLMMIIANLMAIYGASWDLLVGRTGQISLGHALFFGIGAYATALLYVYLNLQPWATIFIAALIGFVIALLIGFPCLRVKGPYLALVTMAFPLIMTGVVYYFKDITGGERGIYGIPRLFPFLNYNQQRFAEYYFTLILMLISSIIIYKIANSKTGIVFLSILDDELASKACGINVTKYKIMAFAISGLFASLAGAVNAHILSSASAASFTLTISFMPVIITIFGGIGTIYGPISAAYVLQILDRYLLYKVINVSTEWRTIIYVVIVIVLILKWPRGIARTAVDKLKDLEEARPVEVVYKKMKKKEESSGGSIHAPS